MNIFPISTKCLMSVQREKMFLDALDVARHEKQALNHSQVAEINRNLKKARDRSRKNARPVLPSLGQTGADAGTVTIEETLSFNSYSLWHSVKICVTLGDIPNFWKAVNIGQGVCLSSSPFPTYQGCLPARAQLFCLLPNLWE